MKLVNNKVLSFILILCCSSFVYGQQSGMGLVIEDDQITPAISNFSGAKYNETSYKHSLKQYAPTPGEQGDIGSCVGWSSAYAALTIMYAQRNGWKDQKQITKEAFSPNFLYNQIKNAPEDCSRGITFSSAFLFLRQNGVCKRAEFNVSEEDCSTLPSPAHLQRASQNRIQGFYRVFQKTDTPEDKIKKIKKSISEGYPVVSGLIISEDFHSMTKDDAYWKPNPNSPSLGGHAMVVVGYNDIKKAFEIMNSWGTNWGNKGFIWIKYDDFIERCKLAYQISIPETDENDENTEHAIGRSQLHGDFAFRYPTDMIGDSVVFEKAAVTYKGTYYELKRKDFEVGQLFQLVTKNVKKNRYVYVFSIDGNNKATLHWPKTSNNGAKYTETPLVPYDNAEIVVPGDNRAFQKEVAGNDYLFVLYSRQEIRNIDIVMEKVRQSKLPMDKRLFDVLGGKLISNSEIQYDTNNMHFTTTATRGYIVPILLVSKND